MDYAFARRLTLPMHRQDTRVHNGPVLITSPEACDEGGTATPSCSRRSLHSGGAQGVRPPCRPRSRPLRPARRSGKARRLQELLLSRDRQAHHVLRAWPAAYAARDAQEAPVLANVGGRRRAQCRRGRGCRLLHLCVPPVQQAGHRRALGAAAPARGRRRARSGHGG